MKKGEERKEGGEREGKRKRKNHLIYTAQTSLEQQELTLQQWGCCSKKRIKQGLGVINGSRGRN